MSLSAGGDDPPALFYIGKCNLNGCIVGADIIRPIHIRAVGAPTVWYLLSVI